MKHHFNSGLVFLLFLFFFSIAVERCEAQYAYDLVDTAHDINVTYDSPELITSLPFSTAATTSDSVYDSLDFEVIHAPAGGDEPSGAPGPTMESADILLVSDANDTGAPSFAYAFPVGIFGRVGTFNTLTYQGAFPAELSISEVPEPSEYMLLLFGGAILPFAKLVRRKRSGA